MHNSDSKVQQAVKYYTRHHEREVIRLKMKHVEGAFALLAIGLVASSVCFILEWVVYVCKQHRQKIPFNL